ncbi:MAG: hypothetical protein M1358_24075 [Chloroflexi bacterium]|nr:hypothetical protein [Chloroflexota bacterium]
MNGASPNTRPGKSVSWAAVPGSTALVFASLISYPWHRSLLPIAVLTILGLLLLTYYALFAQGSRDRSLRRSLVFALGVGISYPLTEWFLFRFVDVARYEAVDWLLLATPVFVLLLWVYAILLLAIISSGLANVFSSRLGVLGLITGLLAALGGPAFETAGNLLGLWTNTPSAFMLGYVPLYVVLGYFFTFGLLPYTLKLSALGGVATSALLVMEWVVFQRLLSLLGGT